MGRCEARLVGSEETAVGLEYEVAQPGRPQEAAGGEVEYATTE